MPTPPKSVTLEKLRAGEPVWSFKSNFSCPRAVEMPAICGFDCLWVCDEHVANDRSVLEAQILAARVAGADVMVRVAKGSYNDYVKPLELGAAGLMVPHVRTAEEARWIVRQTRFHPLGLRPIDGGNRDGLYCLMPFKEYLEFCNRNRFVLVQIEDVEAMDELEAICAVDGIDIVFFGPADFSQSLGRPGDTGAPEVLEARRRVAKAALAAGKFAGTVGTPATASELLGEGFRFINLGSDVGALGKFCRESLEAVKGTAK